MDSLGPSELDLLLKDSIGKEVLKYFKTIWSDFRDQNPNHKNLLARFQSYLQTKVFPETFKESITEILKHISHSSKISTDNQVLFTQIVYKEASHKVYYRVDLIDDRGKTYIDTMQNNDALLDKINEAIELSVVKWKLQEEKQELIYTPSRQSESDNESIQSEIPLKERVWKNYVD